MRTVGEGCSVEAIAARIAPLRERLAGHRLYARIQSAGDVRVFLESHVFAVWDFMSLLKGLQRRLTCVETPWHPTAWPESRRFVNEIVLGEESDVYEGRAVSHFELYREAMLEAGADTGPMDRVLRAVGDGDGDWMTAMDGAPAAAREFVAGTFALIAEGKVHAMAAAFTFGREDVIPEMFRGLVRDLNAQFGGRYGKLSWYLERHIEVDGEDHGPLALRMVADLCGEDERNWDEAGAAAEMALRARLALWDGIADGL
jgi:hypothetical protein